MSVVKTVGPLSIAIFIAGIVAVLIGQLPLAMIMWVASFVALALRSMKHGAEQRVNDPSEALDPEGRALFLGIRNLCNEIQEMLRKNHDSMVVQVVGKETEQEIDQIRSEVAHAIKTRTEIRKALRTVASSLGPDSEAQLPLKKSIAEIDEGIEMARTTIGDIKTRLATMIAGETIDALETEGLRESISRLKTLGASYAEANEFLTERKDL